MVSLYSTWWVKPECKDGMQLAIDRLVASIKENEKDTIMYLVHFPRFDFPDGGKKIISVPMVKPGTLVFVEKYRDWDAFKAHLDGDAFKTFFRENKDNFVSGHDGLPFIEVVFMEENNGFVREEC